MKMYMHNSEKSRVRFEGIDSYSCAFENDAVVNTAFELFNPKNYSESERKLIEEFNDRAEKGNALYYMARHRESMFASGFEAGMYIATFDRKENLTSFTFTDGTRKMLGYDGLEDLPNEFASWEKTLIPEERESIVALFWNTVKVHRQLPDISHAEYRMVKKDGSIIWVTGAGKFVRREDDGSLEIYMGCYREVTAEHEKAEYLKIIEGVGKVFNFSIYIDMKDFTFKTISTNEIVEKVKKSDNAFEYLKENVKASVSSSYHDDLIKWFNPDVIVSELEKISSVSKDFYSSEVNGWFRGIFMVGDRNEDGSISHIIYGCQDITEAKEQELRTLAVSKKQLQTLKSMSEVFYSMHLINLKTDSITVYNAENEVKNIVEHSVSGSAKELMTKVISKVTNEAYRKDALFFTDLSTVADRMKNKKIISSEFVGKRVGWFLASFITIEAEKDGRPVEVLFTTRVIDKEKQREEKLLKESNTDQLTGVYNRRAYEDAIQECELSGLSDTFVYIAIDINSLKVTNDTIGHEAGDELITGASDCLRHCLKPYGNIYRTGGDEFAAIIDADAGLLEEIKINIEEACNRWKGKLVDKLSLSCGYVAAVNFPGVSLHEMIVTADERMYKAKSDYYHTLGIDRRGQHDAHKALCALYTKILKINVTDDTYQIINMDDAEKSESMGFADRISKWLSSFGKSGQVHPDDLEEYLRLTDLKYISDYFKNQKTSLHVFYRRKCGDAFKQFMMEIIPASDYREDSQSLYLYVKNIDM